MGESLVQVGEGLLGKSTNPRVLEENLMGDD